MRLDHTRCGELVGPSLRNEFAEMRDEALAAADADVFVSYASTDTVTANVIVTALERNGLRCWIAPRDVVPGSLYAEEIVRAINATRFFVLVLSEHAIASGHVGKELERASSKRHPIFAVRTDAATLTHSFEYFLSESQWIDVGPGDVNAAAEKLAEAVRRHSDPGRASGSRVPPDRPAPNHATSALRKKRIAFAGSVIGAFALCYFVIVKFWLPNHSLGEPVAAPTPTPAPVATVVSEKSIAVLPFTDMSEKKDQEYLADGMAEEILNLLAQVPDLLVPARTSSFYFKGKQAKISDIAKELGVAHVLEGSVRRVGDHLRVTAQLVRADSGYHVWSETYDRELQDVFKVQDDIANAVAQALQIKLMGGELNRRRGGTQNLEAYQLYLRAKTAINENTKTSLKNAGEYLDQAIKIDPHYGNAWSALAYSVIVETDNGYLDTGKGYERVRELAEHALQLSPDLADAHACLQYVYRTLDWNWKAAEEEGRKALAIDPNNISALLVTGMLSYTLGRWSDAERYLTAASTRDPLNTYVTWNLATAYYLSGRFADAEAIYRRLLEMAPSFLWTRPYLSKTLLVQGKLGEALAMSQQDDDVDNRLLFLPSILEATRNRPEADEALAQQIARFADTGASYYVALTYAYRGDRDRALEWLERAYEKRDHDLAQMVGEPLLHAMRGDARYRAFLRKMNLPE